MYYEISTFKSELVGERIICGLERYRLKGIKLSRPSSMTKGLKNAILLLNEKGVGVRLTCRQLGIGTNSYYSVVKETQI